MSPKPLPEEVRGNFNCCLVFPSLKTLCSGTLRARYSFHPVKWQQKLTCQRRELEALCVPHLPKLPARVLGVGKYTGCEEHGVRGEA